MFNGFHRESLKNFLEVIDLGVELSNRGSDKPKSAGKQEKRFKVDTVLSSLRARNQC
jgi:hypothetical protein